MNDEELTALGHILGTAVMFSAIVLHRHFREKRRTQALEDINQILIDGLESGQKREIYLASLLDEHGIELTEFDRIAMYES